MSHSKRNTSRPVFTAHERALAKSAWATSTARLSRDSYLPFGSCTLCLELARDPVACHRGDLFCRECALSNILAQKRELKRAEKMQRSADMEKERARAQMQDEEQERAVRDFELTQAGLTTKVIAGRGPSSSFSSSLRREEGGENRSSSRRTEDVDGGGGGENEERQSEQVLTKKRKFSLDAEEMERAAQEDRARARKAIEHEKAAKPSLPSFWTPSLTPQAGSEAILSSKEDAPRKKIKTTPLCPSSTASNPHSLTLQKMLSVHFHEEESTNGSSTSFSSSFAQHGRRRNCFACLKALTNSSSPIMAKPCGHVLCLSCVKQFLLPASVRMTASEERDKSKGPSSSGHGDGSRTNEEKTLTVTDARVQLACYVCSHPISGSKQEEEAAAVASESGPSKNALPPGLVELKSEGTGFSARGGNVVAKTNVAFQC